MPERIFQFFVLDEYGEKVENGMYDYQYDWKCAHIRPTKFSIDQLKIILKDEMEILKNIYLTEQKNNTSKKYCFRKKLVYAKNANFKNRELIFEYQLYEEGSIFFTQHKN